jgi:carboxypeptidase T
MVEQNKSRERSMITSIASVLAIALQSQVYLVEFNNKETENKARISFHHSLVSDKGNGILMRLSSEEVSKLTPFAKAITPANEEFEKLTASYSKQAKSAKQQAGIPGYACYTTVEETFSEVTSLVEQYPDQTEWVDIGDSWQKEKLGAGYDIKVLKLGNINSPDAPILFMQSGMHAREYAPVGLTLAFAKELLENQDANPDYKWILGQQQIHILFHSNPDGRKIAETGLLQRKNHNESYCAASYVGVDLNRNFSYGWGEVAGGSSGEACSEVYRGPSAGSEPETQAVEKYVRGIFPDLRGDGVNDKAPDDRSGLYLDIHSYSELVLWPWGGTELPAPNEVGLKSLGHKLAYFNNYEPMQSVGLYPTDGTSDNLAYNELGVAHITFEIGTKFFQDCETFNNKIKPDNIKATV